MSVRMPVYAKGYAEVVSWDESFVGAVFETRERNGYHDSDFYAVVWDGEANTLREVEYATTRFAGGGHAEADLSDETLADANEYLVPFAMNVLADSLNSRRAVPTKGDNVTVTRGKFKGTTGRVFWVGTASRYTYNAPLRTRVGVSPSGEMVDGKYTDAVWTSLEYLETERDTNPTAEEYEGFAERLTRAPLSAYSVVRASERMPEGWIRV